MSNGKEVKYAGRIEDLPLIPTPDHKGTTKRVIFGPGQFWEDHVARFFTVDPGNRSPFHAHDWPHYVLIVEGVGEAHILGDTYPLEPGYWAFVPSNTEHFFENKGEGPLKFVCIVPRKGDDFQG